MLRMKRVSICVWVVLLWSLLLAGGAEAAEKVHKWRTVSHASVGTNHFKMIEQFCESVKAASQGRLIIEPYGAGVLFPVFNTFDSVKNGLVEMGMCSTGYWVGRDPAFGIFATRPGCPIRIYDEIMYLDQKAFPLMENLYAKHGVVLLGTFDTCTAEPLMFSKKKIASLADFKGLNIRTSGIGAQFYKALGASPVSVSGPEIYTALQLGTVDAAEWMGWRENMEMAFQEVTKYVLDPACHIGGTSNQFLMVNPGKWNELPDDLKKIVILAMDEARYTSAITVRVSSAEFERKWRASGAEIFSLPDDEYKKMQEIGMQVYKDYAESNPIGKEYLKIYAEVLYELGYTAEAEFFGYKAQ